MGLHLLTLFILGGLLAPACWGEVGYNNRFRVTLRDGSQVDAYATKPALLLDMERESLWSMARTYWRSRANAQETATLLGHAADFIDAYSRVSGFIHPSTSYYHRREIRMVRQGRWPMVVITEPGNPAAVLLTVAVAIPWGAEVLPFQYRFYKRGIAGLPNSYPGLTIEMQNFFDEERGYWQPMVLYDEHTGRFSMEGDLSVLLSQLPWAVGHSAELKFFYHRPGVHPQLSAIAHALITAFGLHRFAVDPLPKWMRAQQVDFMSDPTIKAQFLKDLQTAETFRLNGIRETPEESAEAAQLVQSFFSGLRQVLWQKEGFQRLAGISSLFAQVSEREEETKGSLHQMFLRLFNFPRETYHDFVEDARTGTPGVRTRIYRLTMENFDLDMLDGLNRQTQQLGEGANFQRIHPTSGHCPSLVVDYFEQAQRGAYREFMRLQNH